MKIESVYFNSPIGWLCIQGDAKGIISIEYVFKGIKTTLIKNKHIQKCVRELDQYFKEKRKVFSVKLNPHGTQFQKGVWNVLQKIPHGKTCSYKDIAEALGNPRAVRAVGNANGKNPIPIIIPCHRVIAHDGGLGGYSGGISKKKWLLRHENAEIPLNQ